MDIKQKPRFSVRLKSICKRLVAAIIIFMLGAAVGLFAVSKLSSNTLFSARKILLPGEFESETVTVETVKTKILEIGELSSCECEYVVTKGKDFTRHFMDDIPIPGTTNHVELTCTGSVKIGYNLNDAVVEVDEISRTIYIRLPEPHINSNQIYWDERTVNTEQNNILNPIDFAQYQGLIREIKELGLEKAEENGAYPIAQYHIEKLVSNFLGCYTEYSVKFL